MLARQTPARGRSERLLAPAERGQPSGALPSDESLQPGVKNCGLLLQSAQSLGFPEQIFVQVESRSHMHQHAQCVQARQASLAAGGASGASSATRVEPRRCPKLDELQAMCPPPLVSGGCDYDPQCFRLESLGIVSLGSKSGLHPCRQSRHVSKVIFWTATLIMTRSRRRRESVFRLASPTERSGGAGRR